MSRPNAPGFLVVFEGIDGSGKSTALQRLCMHAAQRGLTWVASAEPTRGMWGMKLRQSMVQGSRLPLDKELEYFVRDRKEHYNEVVKPALAAGKVVILDRYYFSNAAYQGARGADPEQILQINETYVPQPDLVLLLDFEPVGGFQRIKSRGDTPNSFEDINQLVEVRRIYLEIQRPYIKKINAALEQEAVWKACYDAFDEVVK